MVGNKAFNRALKDELTRFMGQSYRRLEGKPLPSKVRWPQVATACKAVSPLNGWRRNIESLFAR
jgi:hypothetical protein